MSGRLLLLVALASIFTVSYGLDCIQCVGTSANDNCQSQSTPTNATTCATGSYCAVISVTTSDAWTSFVRSCTTTNTNEGCFSVLFIRTCSTYCTTDGCNNGDAGSGAGMVRASALFLIVSAILSAILSVY
ncbi:uncharacterized protein LOC118406848 [Branchiostoma floridae]|uniref:Uncharacterized protein LOC118406848 n=1 Tax=Branchiostoma floridae TaxID=7739 RepID=C3Y790_BRAFL|nr:uncharacterized protein LOC118406848 [Branchiostoma floridae]|eukprot:XP_002607708.1 hypothetical protein BRAFLDRAFT_123260 [Branchiostoma floridae]